MTFSAPVPRLLVSVRDAREAVCALQGGADVIDFKNPDRGPLGRADVDVMAAAIKAIQEQGGKNTRTTDPPAEPKRLFDKDHMALSSALGELIEYDGLAGRQLPPSIAYLKLGLSGLRTTSNWVQKWLRVRADVESLAAGHVQWVAVAYADAEAAAAPPVADIVQAAAATRCAGVLIDTFDKAGGRLLDHFDTTALRRLARGVQNQQMFFAVAGRLQIADFAALSDVGPNILAVRSAACDGENRNGAIVSEHVAAARQAIQRAFDP